MRDALARLWAASGLAAASGGARRLHLAVVSAGTALAVVQATEGEPVRPVLLTVAVAVCAAAQVAGVRIRVGATMVTFGWGEAALIVELYLIPAAYLPIATLAGVLIAMLIGQAMGRRRAPVTMAFNAAALSLSAAAAAMLVSRIGLTYLAPLTPRVVAALVLSAPTYAAVSLLLASWMISIRTGTGYGTVAAAAFWGNLFILIGNVAIGLVVVAISDAQPWWLLALAPIAALLRQGYVYRVRVDEERRGWAVFARATRAFYRQDEQRVAQIAADAAAQLFPVERAEVRLGEPGRVVSHLNAAPSGQPSGHTGAPAGAAAVRRTRTIGRMLLVGGVPAGEVVLHFTARPRLTAREQLMLAAYADAVSAALSDAAAQQALTALGEVTPPFSAPGAITAVADRAGMLAAGSTILRALPPQATVALLSLDLNRFREINDSLGHPAGDEVLRIIADRLAEASGPTTLVGRLGGDEFAVLLTAMPPAPAAGRTSDVAALGYAQRRARELQHRVADPLEVAGVGIAVEAAVGVAVARAGEAELGELLRRADIALEWAKRDGVAVASYRSGDERSGGDRLRMLAELRDALRDPQQLVLVLQPVIDLASSRPVAVEALVRWRHPDLGELQPADFLEAIEHSELIAPFTRCVLERALAIAASWHGLNIPISVNLSARSLLDKGLPAEVARLLAQYRVAASMLVLEITEAVLAPEHAGALAALVELRELGVQLAVDDFGSLYSSLTFLTRVPVDEVKVDRSFVGRMMDSPEASAIVKTAVDLARSLGLRVVAEGVESAAQVNELVGLGCSRGQGFHFFAPMPPERTTALLRMAASGC